MKQMIDRLPLFALSLVLPVITLLQSAAFAAAPATHTGIAIGYTAHNGIGRVTVNDAPALVIRGSLRNTGTVAREVALTLNTLNHNRQLRADQILPAVSNGRYEVRVGKQTLLVIDPAMAKAEKAPPALVAMRMINQLRQSLGGVPFESQASRGLMATGRVQHGEATWYGNEFNGRPTTSGQRYDVRLMTAAHRTLPFGTLCLVTHSGNGRSVLVRVNDRGPWGRESRIIDLTPAAYRLLAPLNSGVIPIKIDILR